MPGQRPPEVIVGAAQQQRPVGGRLFAGAQQGFELSGLIGQRQRTDRGTRRFERVRRPLQDRGVALAGGLLDVGQQPAGAFAAIASKRPCNSDFPLSLPPSDSSVTSGASAPQSHSNEPPADSITPI